MKKRHRRLFRSTFVNVQGKTLHIVEFGSKKFASKSQRIKKLATLQQISLNHSAFGPTTTR